MGLKAKTSFSVLCNAASFVNLVKEKVSRTEQLWLKIRVAKSFLILQKDKN